jgi:hypothetical protein
MLRTIRLFFFDVFWAIRTKLTGKTFDQYVIGKVAKVISEREAKGRAEEARLKETLARNAAAEAARVERERQAIKATVDATITPAEVELIKRAADMLTANKDKAVYRTRPAKKVPEAEKAVIEGASELLKKMVTGSPTIGGAFIPEDEKETVEEVVKRVRKRRHTPAAYVDNS